MARIRLTKKSSTPARQVTGTTYQATPAANIKAPTLAEIGSQTQGYIVDPVPELATPIVASRTYTQMIRGDASVRMSLNAGKAPVLGAEFFVDPYSTDPLDLAIWEFVHFNLFEGMTTPWAVVLEQILTMYQAALGNSIFELVWENREWAPRKTNAAANRKVYTTLRKMAYRPPTTISQITYDKNGGPASVIQQALDPNTGQSTQQEIPIDKCAIFTLNQEGKSAVEGLPFLRSAYKHWFYKDRLYAIDAIQKERHGIGVPDVEIQPGAAEKDIQAAHTMASNLRTNEYSYIVRPPTIKVGFAEIKGNPVNVLQSIDHHDTMIMKNLMVQFLNMGTGAGGGGRATAATAMDMFLKSMRHVADGICGIYNLYVIPRLVAYNFPTDKFPQLKARNVGEAKDLQMWAAAMRNLIDVGGLTVDEETEAWIRDQMDMPRLQTPWVPLEKRPARVSVVEALNLSPKTSSVNSKGQVTQTDTGIAPTANLPSGPGQRGITSPNGGAGNVGKSPSSGAV